MPALGDVSSSGGNNCFDEDLTGADGKIKASYSSSSGVTNLAYYTGASEPYADTGDANEIWTFTAD